MRFRHRSISAFLILCGVPQIAACGSSVAVRPYQDDANHHSVYLASSYLKKRNCQLPVSPASVGRGHDPGDATPCAMELVEKALSEKGACPEGFEFIRRMADVEGGGKGFLIRCK